jgi:phage-related protein
MDVIAEGLMPIAQILVDLVVNAAPSLTEFFRLLADALAELAPIAAPVGKALGLLVLLLSDVLAGVLPLVIELLGFLADVLIVILTPLEPLVRQMIPMLTLLFHQLFDALQPLLPALFAVAMTLAQAFIDNKDAIITLLVQWIDLFTILAQKMTGEFVQALTMIIPLLPGLVESGLAFSQVLLELAQTLMPLIMLFLDLTNNGEAWRILLLAFIGWSIIATNVIQLFITWLRALYEIFRLIIQVLDWVIEQIKRFVSWVTSGFSQISSAIGGALHNAYQAILNFGVNMYNAGANLISQLIGGIKSMLGPVGNAVGAIVQRAKDYFNWSPAKRGPLSGRGDMRYAGQNLVGRLVEGVQQGMTEAEQAAATLAGLFGVGGAGRFAFAGVGGAAGGQPRPIYAFVQIGERPVKEMVEATILDNPEAVAKATSEGNRQDAAITGRKRIGDT